MTLWWPIKPRHHLFRLVRLSQPATKQCVFPSNHKKEKHQLSSLINILIAMIELSITK